MSAFDDLRAQHAALPAEVLAQEELNKSIVALNASINAVTTAVNTKVFTSGPTVYSTATLVVPTITVLLVSLVIAPANANRKGFIIWNNSANSCYVTLGPVSTSSTCARLIPTFASWEFYQGWTGQISAIRNAGTGAIAVWELT